MQFSFDIVGLYLNIPHKDGLSHSSGYLDKHYDKKKINEQIKLVLTFPQTLRQVFEILKQGHRIANRSILLHKEPLCLVITSKTFEIN